MDYNNIKTRLNRIYASIKQKAPEDVDKYTISTDITSENYINHIRPEFQDIFKGKKIVGKSISFGEQNGQENAQSIITSILHQIATLKDNIKNKLKDKKYFENAINNNRSVCILLDIVNQDKHGYPLTKTNRSNLNPLLKNFSYGLMLIAGGEHPSEASIRMNKSGGLNILGDKNINISCDVFDGKGSLICSIDKVIDDSIAFFEGIIKKAQLR